MLGAMLALVLITAAAVLMGGCTKAVYLPAESGAVRTDTLAVLRWRTDTVIDRDTVTLTQRGDTVYLTKTQWRWRVKETRDTVYQLRTDSVYVEKPYPVEKIVEVEKPLTWWQKSLIWIGIASLASIVILAIYWHKRR